MHRIIVAAAPKAVVIGDISASGEAAAYQQTTAADSEQLVTFREALARRSRYVVLGGGTMKFGRKKKINHLLTGHLIYMRLLPVKLRGTASDRPAR